MAIGRTKVWGASEDINSADLNAEFDNLLNIFQNELLLNIPDKSITETKLAIGASPAVYYGEIHQSQVVTTGFTYVSASGLDVTVAAGTAYVLNTSGTPDKLLRVEKTGTTVLTMADNTTNYVDISSAGVFDVNANSAPAADHIRMLKIIASGGSVSSDEDVANRVFGSTDPRFQSEIEWEVDAVTTVTIQSGGSFRGLLSGKLFTFDANQTADITATGANGLMDGDTESSSTWYALVGVGDTTGAVAPKLLLVDTSDYPASIVLPTGYDDYKRLGWVRNDGSSDLLVGEYIDGRFHYEEGQQVLTAGASATFAGVSCASFVPPTIRSGLLYGNIQTGGSSGSAQWRTTGNGATTGKQWGSAGSETSGYGGVFLLDSSQSIDYQTSVGTFDIWVEGWVDNLEKDS